MIRHTLKDHMDHKTGAMYHISLRCQKAQRQAYKATGSSLQTEPRADASEQPRTATCDATLLGCSGDLVSRLSNGPYGASYGL